jgi:hypothetical protein
METHQQEKLLLDSGHPPETPSDEGVARKLEVAVLFTSFEATLAAARRASKLIEGLDGRISLVDTLPVPYPLPVDRPPVSLAFAKRRLLTLVEESGTEMTAHVFLCRFRFEALLLLLKQGALIVMGCRKTLWPIWEKRLARKLRRAGYQILLIES